MKLTFKAIGIALALIFVLASLPVSALSEPKLTIPPLKLPNSASPTPATPTPTPTPTPGGKTIPGDGKRPDGEPPGDGDGPGNGGGEGEQKPPTPPIPPGKEPPTEPPIEIEIPEDGSDADIKPKKGKKKEYEKQAVWTISFNKAKTSAPAYIPDVNAENYTLDFKATKADGSEGMLGSYQGDGYLLLNYETSVLLERSKGNMWIADMSAEGPFSSIKFDLVRPSSSSSGGEDDLAPLAPTLAPLTPDKKQMPDFTGETKSSMTWNVTSSAHVEGKGLSTGGNITSDLPMPYFLYVYPNGKAEISLHYSYQPKPLNFWGTISKKTNWKQVK